jgi:hypothetical protein
MGDALFPRRFVLGMGIGCALAGAATSHPPPSPWDGRPFAARCGVNLVPLGFAIYRPVAAASWDESLPAARLDYLRTVGFDHARIAFDPTPALAAADDAALSAALAVADHAVDATLRAGLKVILDLHVATSGAWSTAAIEADYPHGPRWRRYLDVARAFGLLCARYPPAQVAFEPYNENSNNETYGNRNWARRVLDLWSAIRAANASTTLLIGGSFYSGIDGLADLDASDYDANTGFVVHNYEPSIFTHQNATWWSRFVERLHYPPIPSDRARAIAAMTALVDSSDLGETEKRRARDDRIGRLSAYFDAPQGPAYLSARLAKVRRWQERNRVEASRIFVTEFGAHNDRDFRGADEIARIAWMQDADLRHERLGYCRTVWDYNSPDYWDITSEEGTWRIRDGFLLALGQVPTFAPPAEAARLLAALGAGGSRRCQAMIGETVRQLQARGLWDKLDALYIFSAAKEGDALTDWKTSRVLASDNTLAFSPWLGLANKAQVPASLSVGALTNRRGAHIGLFVVGEPGKSAIAIDRGSGPEPVRLAGGGLPGAGTIDQGAGIEIAGLSDGGLREPGTHVILESGPRGCFEYIDGSAVGQIPIGARAVGSSAFDGFKAEAGPGLGGTEVRLHFLRGNLGHCAALHIGAPLAPEEAKILYTLVRFHIQGVGRQASA